MSSLLAEIADLKSRQDTTDGRLDATDERLEQTDGRVDHFSSELDKLNSKAIVEDYFYTNENAFAVVRTDCYPKMPVEAYETFDFSANLSLKWNQSPQIANFVATLLKDGEEVAVAADDRGLP